MRFLIAYDICDPKRLRKVARCLERHGLRAQKSVFLADLSDSRLRQVFQELQALIRDPDIVQAWRLNPDQPATGAVCGTSVTSPAASVVADARQLHRIIPSPVCATL